jgi:membrane fusion protein (multidrug efflux system)
MTEQLPPEDPVTQPAYGRMRWLLLVGGVAALAIIGFAVHYGLIGRYHVTTDDAYVNGNLVRIAPQVSGTVVAIHADAPQFVNRGQLLVQLDRGDCEVALARAESTLAQTVRDVVQLFENTRRDEATVEAQQVTLATSIADLERDRSLASVHGVSAETLAHEQQTVRGNRAALAQAQATLAAARAAVAATTAESHPRVLEAEANVRAAWLGCARTQVLAPVSGYVVRRAVQLGQQVAPGAEMLAIMSGDSVWIDANFKETQLAGLRAGQPVAVRADMYGSRSEYHGKVLGVTAATGSALSVLPALNASGNWIKVVQRLPVRISLDTRELAERPLPLGASTSVDVDTHDQGGTTLSMIPTTPAPLATDAYAAQDAGVEGSIAEIVSRNLPDAYLRVADGLAAPELNRAGDAGTRRRM